MTAEEFWEKDPFLVRDFRKALRIRNDMKNQELWLQGLYIYNAFANVIAASFSKNGSNSHYLDEPIDLHPEETAEKRKEEARKKIVAELNAWKKAWDSKNKGAENGISNS